MISESHLSQSAIRFSLSLHNLTHHVGPARLVEAVSCSEHCRLVEKRATALNLSPRLNKGKSAQRSNE